ncbi:MAG: porin family protein [Pseudomonadota bacterium]|nr:porin family protein [Pseudomonadota bacterium]
MFKQIAFAATFALLAASAFAADRPAFYAGADVGSTKLEGIADRQSSFGGFVGYAFNQNIAVEAGYRRLADFDVTAGGRPVGVTLDQSAVSVVGTLPLNSGFSLFSRLGYNRIDAKGTSGYSSATDSTSGVLYGIGVGYSFTPAITARLEAQKPSSDSSNIGASVSLKF